MKSGPPPGYRQKQRYDFNLATEFKAGAYKWSVDPSEGYKVEKSIKPEDFNKEDKSLEVVIIGSSDPVKESKDCSVDVVIGGYGNDQAKSYSILKFNCNSDMDAGVGL
tara:strand:- start:583 stop:906 length:324 start_codon:yes stop_codon:yes gene_type:complete